MELAKVAGLGDDGLMRLGKLVLHWFIHSLSVDWWSTEMIGANLCNRQSGPTRTKSTEFDDDDDDDDYGEGEYIHCLAFPVTCHHLTFV